jgi:hypothetical protein
VIAGRIKKLDVANRKGIITTHEGEDVAVTFPDGAVIEVAEPETMGTMGGELADLQEGFEVELEVTERDADGDFPCSSLLCVS